MEESWGSRRGFLQGRGEREGEAGGRREGGKGRVRCGRGPGLAQASSKFPFVVMGLSSS